MQTIQFHVSVQNPSALQELHQEGPSDKVLQLLDRQFARLFVDGRIHDIYQTENGPKVAC